MSYSFFQKTIISSLELDARIDGDGGVFAFWYKNDNWLSNIRCSFIGKMESGDTATIRTIIVENFVNKNFDVFDVSEENYRVQILHYQFPKKFESEKYHFDDVEFVSETEEYDCVVHAISPVQGSVSDDLFHLFQKCVDGRKLLKC